MIPFADISISTTVLFGALAAIGGLGGVTTLVLAPRQGRSIAVSASESAVRTVNEAMTTLRADLKQAQDELARAQAELAEAREEREELIERVSSLQMNVEDLSHRLNHYQEHLDRGEMPPPYMGPERRRMMDPSYTGPERRSRKVRRPKKKKEEP